MSDMIDVSITWESPLPVDDLPTVQAYILLKSIGVSNSSIMRKLGYDPEEEMALSQSEDAKMMQFNQQNMQQTGMQPMPPSEPGVPGLPGQPPAPNPLQGGNQQSGGQQQQGQGGQ